MKWTAVAVNTSRGGVVVEAELEQALRDARIAGAAVDVFEREPLPSGPQRSAATVFSLRIWAL